MLMVYKSKSIRPGDFFCRSIQPLGICRMRPALSLGLTHYQLREAIPLHDFCLSLYEIGRKISPERVAVRRGKPFR